MRVIKTKHFPFGGYKAINLFGIVFTKGELSNRELNHEDNLNYISKRKYYTWTKYLSINSSKTA